MWAIASRSASLRCGIAWRRAVFSSRGGVASCVVAQLLEQVPGVVLVAEHGVAGGRLALDDRQARGRSPSAAAEVLLGLGAQVVDVVEHHLVQVADPRVEVAGDGDVEDQGQPVAAGALNALTYCSSVTIGSRRRWC